MMQNSIPSLPQRAARGFPRSRDFDNYLHILLRLDEGKPFLMLSTVLKYPETLPQTKCSEYDLSVIRGKKCDITTLSKAMLRMNFMHPSTKLYNRFINIYSTIQNLNDRSLLPVSSSRHGKEIKIEKATML